MTDVQTNEQRSKNMSQIKATNTKPELLVRKYLHGQGFRYSLHSKKIFGKPDIVLRKLNTLVFVHGCYWHSHKNCQFATVSKSNTEFWKNKIYGNVERDLVVVKKLKKEGWKIFVLWECQLKPNKREKTLNRLIQLLNQ